MQEARYRARVLTRYFVITYAAMLVNTSSFLRETQFDGYFATVFAWAVYLTYSSVYLLPVFLPLLLLNRLLDRGGPKGLSEKSERRRTRIVLSLAVAGFALVQLLIMSDVLIFRTYGFHFNGFLLNLIITPGGIGALEMGTSTILAIVLLILGFVALQAILLLVVLGLGRLRRFWEIALSRRVLACVAILILGLALFQGVAYGVSDLRDYAPVLAASTAFPLYAPVPFDKIGGSLGLTEPRHDPLSVKIDARHFAYPLRPIVRNHATQAPNIVWIVSESWRADMVDPDIMPTTYAFAKKSAWFRRHYSSGNETRMGMYGLFYGLHGTYWFPCIREKRAPVVMDVLRDAGYQTDIRTGAQFRYPEFDRTVFVNIPRSELHEGCGQVTWESDRDRVTELVERIDHRDRTRPFMSFMFFDSPHAQYSFSEACAIRKPYLKDVNYVTIGEQNIELIKNRYINSCNQLDVGIGRILHCLEANGLMDSTIVIITADHGEEFMEKGRWGHGSTFSEEQIHVPLILWVPGQPPREVARMTSHVDIAPTLLRLLGVTNPPSDYSLGIDLLGPESREYAVVSNWDCAVYVDSQYKVILPVRTERYIQQRVTTRDDVPVKDQDVICAGHKEPLQQVARELQQFSR